MAPIAMAFGVLELTGSTEDAAIVIAAPTLASIAVLLIGGVLADRTSRQMLIVFAEALAMLAQFSIAYLFLSEKATVFALTGLMLVLGVAMALNAPASTGLIVQLVEREELQAINALLGMARNGAKAGGAALGGGFS
jgi:MFS family permease